MKIKELYKKCIRSTGRWSDVIPLAVIIAFALICLGELIGELIFMATSFTDVAGNWIEGRLSMFQNPGALAQGKDIATFLSMYMTFIGIWLALIVVVLIFKRNRPMMRCLGKRTGGKTFLTAGLGLLLGFGMNGLCVLISWLMGDIHLSFNEFRPGLFFLFLLAVVIQSGAEEMAMRWYLYQKLRRRYRHAVVAIVINSALFAVMHLGNPGITIFSIIQIAAVGIFLSLIVYYYDGLWLAVFFHAAWNFTQNIIFGLPNSGIVSQYSVFRLEAASARNGFFYHTAFGVEGSIGAAVILVLGCVVLIIMNHRKREKRNLWGAYESEL